MDFTKPVVGDAYTSWSSILIQNFTDTGMMYDGVATMTGVPTGTKRFSSSAFRFEKWNGSAWVEMLAKATQTYDIRVDTADKLNSQAASYYLDNANATGTLAANKGGTGNAVYAVGDLLYADTTTTLARRAGVAVGNVLISGGVGVAPSWAKVDLTVHISGVLLAANGGTGLSSYTAGNFLYAATTSTIGQRTPAQVKTDLVLVKADVGLGSVDNTADTAKPISTATQTALDGKAPILPTWIQSNANRTFVATDNNKFIYSDDASGSYSRTLNTGVFAGSELITVINDHSTSGSDTIVQGSGFTLKWGTSTGTRTIARGSIVTIAVKSSTVAYITGSGIT